MVIEIAIMKCFLEKRNINKMKIKFEFMEK